MAAFDRLFFERLTADPQRLAAVSQAEAVLAQLQRLAGPHPGVSVEGQPDLLAAGHDGIVDVPAESGGALDAYSERLLQLVRCYEPRLRQAEIVSETADPGRPSARLCLSGQLLEGREPAPFVFDLIPPDK